MRNEEKEIGGGGGGGDNDDKAQLIMGLKFSGKKWKRKSHKTISKMLIKNGRKDK